MTLVDKIITLVVSVVLMLVGLLILLTAWGSNLLLNWLVLLDAVKVDGVLTSLVLLLLSAYLIMMVFGNVKFNGRSITRNTALGNVSVSTQTIMDLVAKATETIDGIKNAEVRITEIEPLRIEIGLELFPDFNIPLLTESVQKK